MGKYVYLSLIRLNIKNTQKVCFSTKNKRKKEAY